MTAIYRSLRIHKTNILYLMFWGIVSFVSTFNKVLDNEWTDIAESPIKDSVLTPLFIWIIAFFGDYIYTVCLLDRDTQVLDPVWTKASYLIIEIIFILLLLELHIADAWFSISFIVVLFACMIGLKAASLYVLHPRQKVETI